MKWWGLSAVTGKSIDSMEHILQSVSDILGTPLGSRIERRSYGARIMDLMDYPNNGATRLRIMSETVRALRLWEPRIKLTSVVLSERSADGKQTVTIAGSRIDTGAKFNDSVSIRKTA